MKNIQFLIIITLSSLFLAATLPTQYEAIMEAAIEEVYRAESAEALQAAGNTFERIAKKETDKWHPRYYAAFAQVRLATQSNDSERQDQYLDAALAHVQAAKGLSPSNSELLALEGFVHMLRIPIDPASRGAQYSGMSMAALQQAIALNPNNPRAHYLLAEMQYGTAQFFGSDTSIACASLNKAIAAFENTLVENKLDPTWGQQMAIHSKEQKGCL